MGSRRLVLGIGIPSTRVSETDWLLTFELGLARVGGRLKRPLANAPIDRQVRPRT